MNKELQNYESSCCTFNPGEFDYDYRKGKKKKQKNQAQEVYQQHSKLETKRRESKFAETKIQDKETFVKPDILRNPGSLDHLVLVNKKKNTLFPPCHPSVKKFYGKLYHVHLVVYALSHWAIHSESASVLVGLLWLFLWGWTVAYGFHLRSQAADSQKVKLLAFTIILAFPPAYFLILLLPSILPVFLFYDIFLGM